MNLNLVYTKNNVVKYGTEEEKFFRYCKTVRYIDRIKAQF